MSSESTESDLREERPLKRLVLPEARYKALHDRPPPYDAERIREEGLPVESSPSGREEGPGDTTPVSLSSCSKEVKARVWILGKPVRHLPFSDSSVFQAGDGDETVLTLEHLEHIAKTFLFPVGSILAIPEKGSTSLHHYPNFMAVNVPALHAGFRIPIHPFFQEILNAQGVSPIQLHPNSWRNFCVLFLHCRELNVDPTLEIVRNLLSTRDIGRGYWSWKAEYSQLVMKPSNLGTWRDNWFLLRVPGSFGVNIHPGKAVHFSSAGSSKKQMAEKRVLISKFNRTTSFHYGQLMTPEKLVELGLSSPYPPGGSSGYMDFEYMDVFEEELFMEEPGCARTSPMPPRSGAVDPLHRSAARAEVELSDVAAVVPFKGKAPIVELEDSTDPPLAKLKGKNTRTKKSSRRSRDASLSADPVGRLLENIIKDGREALTLLGKEASRAADIQALREQVARLELQVTEAETERDAALSEVKPLKEEKYKISLELSAANKERDAVVLELSSAREKYFAEGKQAGVDEYVAGYRMKARYIHNSASDFLYGMKVGARQVLNHYNVAPIRLKPRDNAGVELIPRRPYNPPAVGLIKGDHEGVLEAWGVTGLIDGDPFVQKPQSPTVTSAGNKRERDGALRGDASNAPEPQP